jgi:5-(carboxyamino)imidazole ribonucleotide mutase
MKKTEVAVLMGSDSDYPVMEETVKLLKSFAVGYEIHVLSAHRSPDRVVEYVKAAPKKGIKVFICAAGGAAHLAGAVAANTTLPVIGVPVDSTSLKGLDALLATVQMPKGIPVATVAIGKFGAANAAILAIQILALGNKDLAGELKAYKTKLSDDVAKKNEELQKRL